MAEKHKQSGADGGSNGEKLPEGAKAYADGIPVFCEFSELADVGGLHPNPRNPNQHPPGQIELLAKLVRAHGWRAPITVSTRSGFIVRGGARYETALYLGVKQVPIDYQSYASEDEELADLVADNEIARKANTDPDMLGSLLRELDVKAEIDMLTTGFSAEELVVLLGQAPEADKLMDEFLEAEKNKPEPPAAKDPGDNVAWTLLLSFRTKAQAEEYMLENDLKGAFKKNARTLHIKMTD